MTPEIRILTKGEEHVVQKLASGVFDGPIDLSVTKEFFTDPRHHIVVAMVDGTVIGMSSGVHYVHPDKEPEFWINEVGVSENYRGAGIATSLLTHFLEHAKSLGCREAWVLTDIENSTAMQLYSKLGGVAAKSLMFTFNLQTEQDVAGNSDHSQVRGQNHQD